MKSNGLIQKKYKNPSANLRMPVDEFIISHKLDEINFSNNNSLTNIIDYNKNKMYFSQNNQLKIPFFPNISKIEN